MPNRILYTTDLTGLGGGETSLLSHLGRLSSQFTPILLCPGKGMLTNAIGGMGIGMDIISWKNPGRIGFLPRYPLSAAVKVISCLRGRRIELINAGTFNSLAVVAPAAKILRIPVIWTCHGWWPARKATGGFINLFADKVIAVSQYVRKKLEAEGHVDPGKVVHIPLGIDTTKFTGLQSREAMRRELGLDMDTPLVGMIARFQRVKGHHVFVRTAAEILKKAPHVRFLIVGSAVFGKRHEQDYEKEIRASISENSLQESIRLVGFRKDIPRILSSLDLLIVPSETETFGMVLLEGLASGVPVITSAKGGPEEIINNAIDGYLLNEQDPVLIAQKALTLIENPVLRARMGRKGRESVLRKYDIGLTVEATESLYRELLRKKKESFLNDEHSLYL
ncbi:MAG: glycosyltransferase family 4 protein [Pseudomonadota bacterium]